jgi:hypothetical protein
MQLYFWMIKSRLQRFIQRVIRIKYRHIEYILSLGRNTTQESAVEECAVWVD